MLQFLPTLNSFLCLFQGEQLYMLLQLQVFCTIPWLFISLLYLRGHFLSQVLHRILDGKFSNHEMCIYFLETMCKHANREKVCFFLNLIFSAVRNFKFRHMFCQNSSVKSHFPVHLP
jgi:hypothetical protein